MRAVELRTVWTLTFESPAFVSNSNEESFGRHRYGLTSVCAEVGVQEGLRGSGCRGQSGREPAVEQPDGRAGHSGAAILRNETARLRDDVSRVRSQGSRCKWRVTLASSDPCPSE